MTVYINRQPVPGTSRKPASRTKIMRVKKARALWKANARPLDENHPVSGIYGRRKGGPS